ncbi:uncharacterized protein LOC122498921 [Leptopilina heterotoma]|uniref:uncharacterized protein LOC122498921 n=1 Tax=Leptopilina heterotoma TaxID=63436 RepID=UPI001CA8E6C2|nr:uncharacterized protein LOC122498921 [Leptopilina heterotoma]
MTTSELKEEFKTCVRISQQQNFVTEMLALKKHGAVPVGSLTARLKPYLDSENILRVGGRLENSLLSEEEKHPPILSARSILSGLIVDWAHQRALHAGPTVTYAYASRRAWIIGGMTKTKSFIRRCVVCSKSTKRTSTHLMADLPAARVNPGSPLSKVGVDYAGPFQILRSKGRGVSSSKGYVAVFVCLATKAIHLELVGDLSTESFLGCLTRFTCRRGRPLEVWSDNATNFRGADNELRRLFLEAETDWQHVQDVLAQEKTMWRFIPPSAPHFGGLWEAGVKSMKNHLRRITGSRKLTYEQFTTLLVEIEMALNCRPLIPLSGDLDDLDVLTPGRHSISVISQLACEVTRQFQARLDSSFIITKTNFY